MAVTKDSIPGASSQKKTDTRDIEIGLVADLISIGAVCAISYGLSRYLSSKIQQQNLSRPSNQEAKDRLKESILLSRKRQYNSIQSTMQSFDQ